MKAPVLESKRLIIKPLDLSFLSESYVNWLNDEEIGNIDKKWNWLAMEYEEKDDVNLIHYTIGTPCFKEYSNKSFSSYWKKSFSNLLDGYYNKGILK